MGLQEHLLYRGSLSALHTLSSLYSSASSISLPIFTAASAGTFLINNTAVGRKEQKDRFHRLKKAASLECRDAVPMQGMT